MLVLDEPTAQLDPESEAAVMQAMDGLRRGRTVLLVAHRLTTVTRADHVAVVSHGRVVEEGHPGHLAVSGRAYPRLLSRLGGRLVSEPWRRLVSLLAPERRRAAGAATLQVLTLAAGVGLMGTSAWLLSKAALHPSIAAISVAVIGVRAFGVARATLRYLERLASHDVTLRLLALTWARIRSSPARAPPSRAAGPAAPARR